MSKKLTNVLREFTLALFKHTEQMINAMDKVIEEKERKLGIKG